MSLHLLYSLLTLIVTMTTAQGGCPPPCSCFHSQANCHGKGLTNVPNGTFDNRTATLYLHNNQLRSLPAGIFDNNKQLHTLVLSHNQLTSLPDGIFVNNKRLNALYLHKNQLRSLPAGIFDNNKQLLKLYLENNQLRSLPAGIFDNNKQLLTLSLNYNQLTSLPNEVFVHNKQLSALYLYNNQLRSLPAGIFDNNKQLLKLSLSYNQLTSLPNEVFVHNKKLRSLYLGFNQLSWLSAGIFKNISHLMTLYLYNNQLRSLPAGIFDNNKQLRSLYLYHNQLRSLPAGIFDNNNQLHTLILGFNQLTSLPDGIFVNNKQLDTFWDLSNITNVTAIYLHNNQLRSLPAGIFDNNKQLLKLYLNKNQLRYLPAGIFDNNNQLHTLILGSNQLTSLPDGIFVNNKQLDTLNLYNNQLRSLPAGIFDNNKQLRSLPLSYNQLTSLPNEVFVHNKKLRSLNLNHNSLSSLPSELLKNLTSVKEIVLQNNQLTSLPTGVFDNNRQLSTLSLGYNRITHFDRDVFNNLIHLDHLHLAGNKLTNLPQGLFRNITKLTYLSFENNLLENLPVDLLQGMTKLKTLGFSRNKLQSLPDRLFNDTRSIETLFLGMNSLSEVDLEEMTKLKNLMLHQNSITSKTLNRSTMTKLTSLNALWASYNNIEYIEDFTFSKCYNLSYILLNNNKITRITRGTFNGASSLRLLFLSDNPIENIAEQAFFDNKFIKRIYLLETRIKTIDIQWFDPQYVYTNKAAVQIHPTKDPEKFDVRVGELSSGFSSTGFECTMINSQVKHCRPCLSGTYITYDVQSFRFRCIDCPAGGFYEDSIAFYGERGYGNGCKMCNNGTFVHSRNAPGRRKEDCKPCPEGTRNELFAGFRACPCQDGFYRLDRFEKCHSCPDYGVTCFNESITLKPGYYWQWISQSEKENYINFTNNLQVFDDSYNRDLVTFSGSFPKHYQCPRTESCLGGLDSNCAKGYTGPLCAVCDRRHYNLVATCFKCPALHWIIFQICAIFLVVMVIIFAVIKGKQCKVGENRSLTDIILARLKIVVSFYQISSGTLDAFSYVQWPSALTKMSEYAKFVQLNILQIAPLHCFNSRLKVDTYTHLVITCSMTAGVILTALAYYHVKRFYLSKKAKSLGDSAFHSDLDATKEACYRNVFLFIFVTYPQTCSTIFQMLPAACHRICQDSSQTQCTFYLKADYSITCFTDKYNRYVILAYAALIYPFAVPLLTVAVLWKYHYKTTLMKAEKETTFEKMSQKTNEGGHSKTNNRNTNIDEAGGTSATEGPNELTGKGIIQHISPRLDDQDNVSHLQHLDSSLQEIKVLKNLSNTSNVTPAFSLPKAVGTVFKARKVLRETRVEGRREDRTQPGKSVVASAPIVAGMSFIFENYAENCWFWETLEMTRKLLMTSTLALIGAEGRDSLGVASILSGCYAILHAHYKPIPDKFEHVLQLTSLLVTFANTCIGMMLKIDQGALLDADAKIMDSLIITVLLVTANVMVTALVVVKYSVVVGRSIYSLIQNPHCSLECCLSVMLTVNEVQSEARSVETSSSGWKMSTQSQANEFEGVGVADAAGEYGLTEVEMNDEDAEQVEVDSPEEKEEKSEEEEGKNSSKSFGKIGRVYFKRVQKTSK